MPLTCLTSSILSQQQRGSRDMSDANKDGMFLIMLVWGVNFNHLLHKMIIHLIQESGFLSWKNKIQIVSCQIVTLDKQLYELKVEFKL